MVIQTITRPNIHGKKFVYIFLKTIFVEVGTLIWPNFKSTFCEFPSVVWQMKCRFSKSRYFLSICQVSSHSDEVYFRENKYIASKIVNYVCEKLVGKMPCVPHCWTGQISKYELYLVYMQLTRLRFTDCKS